MSSGFANILGLASSIYAIQIFNRYVAYGLDGTLITLTVGAVLAILLEFTFKWIRARLSAALLQPQEALDYDALLAHLNKIDASALQQPNQIRSAMRSQQRLAEVYSPANFVSLLDMPFALLFLLAVLLLNTVLGVLALLICVACFAMALWHGDSLISALEEQREKQQRLDVMVGNAEAVDVVRAHNLHSVVQRESRLILADFLRKRYSLLAKQVQQGSNIQLVSAMTSVVIIGTGAIYVTQGQLDIGSLIGANILALRAVNLVNQVGRLSQSLMAAESLQAEVQESKQLPTRVSGNTRLAQYKGRLELKNIAHTWDDRLGPLFADFSINIQPGEVILLAGSNGSGKTSLARIMAGLLSPQRGQVLVDGIDLLQLTAKDWHLQLGYVAQEPEFVSMSLRANLCGERQLSDERLREILDLCDVLPLVDHHSEGLEQILDQGGAHLPPGIRKRLALARAVLANGQLLILDEPHAGMDGAGLTALMNVLKKLTDERRTIIICAHDRNIVQQGARLVDLNHKPVPVVEQI